MRPPSPLHGLAIVAATAALWAAAIGCGGEDVDRELDRARDRAEEIRRDVGRQVEEAQEDFERRDLLGPLERVFQQPARTSPTVRARGRDEATTTEAFLTDIVHDVDRHWTRTFEAAGLPEPRLGYHWIAPGTMTLTGCGAPADDSVALDCAADDTIYVGQQFAADLYHGVLENLPGEAARYGCTAGDFAVAYVVSHEYAHKLQQELSMFDNRVTATARPFELEADCISGTWACSVYAKGDLEPGDLEEATNPALAVGDFDVGNAQHHGTPSERREALLAGYRSGDPSICERYLPA